MPTPIDPVTVAARLSALEALVVEFSRIGTHGESDRKARLQELERWAENARNISQKDLSTDPFVIAYRASVLSLLALVRQRLA